LSIFPQSNVEGYIGKHGATVPIGSDDDVVLTGAAIPVREIQFAVFVLRNARSTREHFGDAVP